MPLLTIPSGNVASAIGGGYEVANSCMFDRDDEHYMVRTYGTATNTKKFTYSFWIKRTASHSNGMYVFENVGSYGGANPQGSIYFDGSDRFGIFEDTYGSGSGLYVKTNRVFRDFSAWTHFLVAVDSTQSTASSRVKIYVNGSQETSLANSTYPAQDHTLPVISGSGNPVQIGKYNNSNSNLSGYLAEVFFVDGSQLTPSSFGEFDEDTPTVWKPKDCKDDLTFGNNGYYLDFEDSGDLGDDESGNGNDFTENNLAATDSMIDTPTLNYSTFNVLDNTYSQGTFTQGNLKIVTSSSLYCTNTSTFNLTKGKWHFEVKVGDSNGKNCIGIAGATTPHVSGDSTLAFGDSSNEYSYTATGELRHSGSSTGSWGSSFTNGDIIGCAFDLDNNELFFYKNGTIQNSGTAFSITDPTSTLSGGYFVGAGDFASDNTSTMEYNFGSPSYSISSGNTDANGHGNFEHAVKSGHYAINSANLAEFG